MKKYHFKNEYEYSRYLLPFLIKYDMVLYSMHINFDAVRMNSLLGEMLNLEDMELLSEKENCGVIGITKTNNLKTVFFTKVLLKRRK